MSALDTLTDDAIRQLQWYYQIELRPGVLTAGRQRPSLSMVRHQLQRVDLPAARCLDIGTQEGVVPAVLARSGAGRVAAYDRLDLSDRIALVQEAYRARFDYYHSIALAELPGRLREAAERPFDLVVFAGVLYHMVDPLAGLALARSFVREGGLLLVETSAMLSRAMSLHLNAAGRYYPHSNYFQVTTGALDYLLRMLGLRALDCLHSVPRTTRWMQRLWPVRPREAYRVSLVCRAVAEPLGLPGDRWITRGFIRQDLQACGLDFAPLRSRAAPVGYRPSGHRLRYHAGLDAVDIHRSVCAQPRFASDPELSLLRLCHVRAGNANSMESGCGRRAA